VTNLVTEVTKLVTHEESLTATFGGKAEIGGSRGERGGAKKAEAVEKQNVESPGTRASDKGF